MADTLVSFNFEVSSQTQFKRYIVQFDKGCILPQDLSIGNRQVRGMISCGCPGHAVTLARKNTDEVCKHCGAVLVCCLKAVRRASIALTENALPRPRSPAGRTPEVSKEQGEPARRRCKYPHLSAAEYCPGTGRRPNSNSVRLRLLNS